MTRATCPSTTAGGRGVAAGVAVGVGAGVADGATDEEADGDGDVGPLQAASSNSAAIMVRRLIAERYSRGRRACTSMAELTPASGCASRTVRYVLLSLEHLPPTVNDRPPGV